MKYTGRRGAGSLLVARSDTDQQRTYDRSSEGQAELGIKMMKAHKLFGKFRT